MDRSAAPVALAMAASLVLSVVTAAPARADLVRAAELFAAGSWEQARAEAGRDDGEARPGEAHLWRSRLAPDPATALAILHEGLGQRRLPGPVRARLALEAAEIELGRGHAGASLKLLAPLLDDADDLPGATQVAVARALLDLGRGQHARELLVAVGVDDPAHGLSRALLGDLALSAGDAPGALSWYDAAERADSRLRRRLAAGRCRAHLRAGSTREAEALAAQMEALDPDGLAALEIRRALAAYTPPAGGETASTSRSSAGSAASTGAPAAAPAAKPHHDGPPAAGRFALQLGAFADQDRADEFVRRLAGDVPELALEQGVDVGGRLVWRARAGGWDDRQAADVAAQELGARLDLDVRVVDRRADQRPGT
ncbi:MAG: SPOR domain-containing protein [bacterium]|nr:SPOR domain-containing protein [bacterium]